MNKKDQTPIHLCFGDNCVAHVSHPTVPQEQTIRSELIYERSTDREVVTDMRDTSTRSKFTERVMQLTEQPSLDASC